MNAPPVPEVQLKTFDIDGCRDVLAKLERELEQFRQADRRWDQSDHATNFVLTAWHLADWVFKAIDGKPIKSKLAQERGVTIRQFDDAEFYRWVASKCRALEYCRIVGTTSKHASVRRDNPDIGTAIGLVMPFETIPVVVDWGSVDWVFAVVDGDKRIDAIDAFELILGFWTEFIYTNSID